MHEFDSLAPVALTVIFTLFLGLVVYEVIASVMVTDTDPAECGFSWGECAEAYSAPHECEEPAGHRSSHRCGCSAWTFSTPLLRHDQ